MTDASRLVPRPPADDDEPPTTHYSPSELHALLRGERPTTRVQPSTSPLEVTLLDVNVRPAAARPTAREAALHTHEPAPSPPTRMMRRRSRGWLPLALAGGAALSLAGFAGLVFVSPIRTPDASTKRATEVTMKPTLEAAAPRRETSALTAADAAEATRATSADFATHDAAAPAATETSRPTAAPPSAAQAVAWLMTNQYSRAAMAYAALAKAHPNERAYAVLARDLTALAMRRCDPPRADCERTRRPLP
jgi:hypothetical protein